MSTCEKNNEVAAIHVAVQVTRPEKCTHDVLQQFCKEALLGQSEENGSVG